MPIQKHWLWILSTLLILVGFVFLPPDWIESLFRPSSNTGRSGLVLDVYGKVEKKPVLGTVYSPMSKSSALETGDIVITHQDSKVLMGFSPSFWLLPFSKMEFVKKEEQWIGRLVYGEIRKIDGTDSSKPVIELVHNQQLITDAVFSSSRETIVAPLVSLESETFQEISEKDVAPQSGIEKQIYQTLLLHKKFFQSCFIKYYKGSSGDVKGGETVFDLLIDLTGTIETATVIQTDINDKDYLQCLKIVFSRMRFKNFQAKEPLHAIFPLQADLANN